MPRPTRTARRSALFWAQCSAGPSCSGLQGSRFRVQGWGFRGGGEGVDYWLRVVDLKSREQDLGSKMQHLLALGVVREGDYQDPHQATKEATACETVLAPDERLCHFFREAEARGLIRYWSIGIIEKSCSPFSCQSGIALPASVTASVPQFPCPSAL
mmetsp:Transcript_28405/g.44317  ORF Transcript_28405/g.44317 Transcript_28405/m.44317 type:complete len:157 (-) Transcript_28405:613-1083(-)